MYSVGASTMLKEEIQRCVSHFNVAFYQCIKWNYACISETGTHLQLQSVNLHIRQLVVTFITLFP